MPRKPIEHTNLTPEAEEKRLDRNWAELLQELRVTQAGTQIVSAFLLAVAFQQRFPELTQLQLDLYLVLVGLAGVATIIGLAPVILHRTYFRQGAKAHVVKIGNRLLFTEVIVVGLLAIGTTSFVFDFVVGNVAAIIAASVITAVVIVLWVILPRWRDPRP